MIMRELDVMSFGCYDVVSMSCVLLWLVMLCLRFLYVVMHMLSMSVACLRYRVDSGFEVELWITCWKLLDGTSDKEVKMLIEVVGRSWLW